jgi:hypothetical protein
MTDVSLSSAPDGDGNGPHARSGSATKGRPASRLDSLPLGIDRFRVSASLTLERVKRVLRSNVPKLRA